MNMKISQVYPPDPAACVACPYRVDSPSGLWAADQYDMLRDYDKPYPQQPIASFLCHQQNSKLCAGWLGCHKPEKLLALPFLGVQRMITPEDMDAVQEYVHDPRVKLFTSGKEACEHGKRGIENPSSQTRLAALKMMQKPDPISRRTFG
jgi:hypothetical protein